MATPNRVYVILHGLITLVQEPANFRALLIDMPDHRVSAGHWLTEKTIPKGALLVLKLTNVKPGSAQLNFSTNIIFQRRGINQIKRNQYRYAEILLPWPSAIYSLNSTEIGPHLLGDATLTGGTKISDTQVFVYEGVDGTATTPPPNPRASLEGDPSTPWQGFQFFAGFIKPISTIHIFNEPEVELLAFNASDTDHVIEEFRRVAEIFNSPLRLSDGGTTLVFNPVPPELHPYVLDEEALPLSERPEKVFNLLENARQDPTLPYASSFGGGVGGSLVCSGGHGFNP